MVYHWEPWTHYDFGAVVEYDGHLYQVVQPHQSEANWQPPITPALWRRLPENEYDAYRGGAMPHGVQEGQRGQMPFSPQPGQLNPEMRDRGWLTEQRKHELEIAGGLTVAAGVGYGIYEYSKHKHEEEARRNAWQNAGNAQSWQQGAETRFQNYNTQGGSGPVQWLLVRDRVIPQNAIPGGWENGEPLYIARSYYEGGLHAGKAGRHIGGHGGATISFAGSELGVDQFEVLVGNPQAVHWVRMQGPVHVQGQNWRPVEGGRERDGRPIFIAHVQHAGGVHPGKATDGESHAVFGWGGAEHMTQDYEILAYA